MIVPGFTTRPRARRSSTMSSLAGAEHAGADAADFNAAERGLDPANGAFSTESGHWPPRRGHLRGAATP